MTEELTNYIEELLKSEVGFISEETPHFENVKDFIAFIKANCKGTGIINEQTLADFKLQFNTKFINKDRAFYLNSRDFKAMPVETIKPTAEAFNAYKNSNDTNLFMDNFVKMGEFYYCTNDEFMIVKYGK